MKQEIVDLPTHSVTVTQLENLELSQKDLYLGFNHVRIRKTISQLSYMHCQMLDIEDYWLLSASAIWICWFQGGISIEPDESGFEESKSANKTAKNRPSRSKKSSSRQDNTEETNPKK